MTYSIIKSLEDVSINLSIISDKVSEMQREISEILSKDVVDKKSDARILLVYSIKNSFLACRAILRLYCFVHKSQGDSKLIAIMGCLRGLDERSEGEENEKMLDLFLTVSLLDDIYFRIDHFFATVDKSLLSKDKSNQRFCVRITNVLTKLDIDLKEGHGFFVLSYMRNSLHNNGINRNKNGNFSINGRDFVFTKDVKVNCASWIDIFIILESILLAINAILMHPRIKAIHYIPDNFCESNK